MLDGAEKFGDEHGKKLTDSAISIGTTIATSEYKKRHGSP
jgi:hypothetical protein